jgi:hypothetical protein
LDADMLDNSNQRAEHNYPPKIPKAIVVYAFLP